MGKIAVENKAAEKPEYTEERMFFDQVVSKTEDKTSIQLESTLGGDAAVFYRFGSKDGKYYLAVFASGITDKDLILKAWVLDEEGKDKEIGELKLIDNTDTYKLAIETQTDLSVYTKAAITATNKDGDSEKYDTANVVYFAEFDFSKELSQEVPLSGETSSTETNATAGENAPVN